MKVADRKLFFRLVKMGFGQRRKVFTNAMKSGGISTELGKKILESAGIDGGRRGETFSMEEYAALANAWDGLVVNKWASSAAGVCRTAVLLYKRLRGVYN